MKTLSTPHFLLALVPLILWVGWVCQRYDDSYVWPGLFFAGAMLLYLALARGWYRFSVITLVLLYGLTLGSAYIGWLQEKNAVVLAILVGWAVLHFGPKALSPAGVAQEPLAGIGQNKHSGSVGWVNFYAIAGLAVLLLIAAWVEPKVRAWDLGQRYAERGCTQLQVLRNAVSCQDAEGQVRWIDAFHDFKGRRLHYRIWGIEEGRGLLSQLDYSTARLSRRSQVRFVIEDGEIYHSREGYTIFYDDKGYPDTTMPVWVFEGGQWIGTEAMTAQHLQALRFAPVAGQ